jgi:hypothetical protein
MNRLFLGGLAWIRRADEGALGWDRIDTPSALKSCGNFGLIAAIGKLAIVTGEVAARLAHMT